jgi:hypothetical protein
VFFIWPHPTNLRRHRERSVAIQGGVLGECGTHRARGPA